MLPSFHVRFRTRALLSALCVAPAESDARFGITGRGMDDASGGGEHVCRPLWTLLPLRKFPDWLRLSTVGQKSANDIADC
jgi:hypothetical protein